MSLGRDLSLSSGVMQYRHKAYKEFNLKIDLEIATGNYLKRLNNNEENLKQFKHLIEKLNQYYRMFKRDK